MSARTIVGDAADNSVEIDGTPLDPAPSQKLRNHSPDGFNWGYGGSGPAQLALAILLATVGKEKAEQWYQIFKFEVIARQPQGEDFTLELDVDAWIAEQERQRNINRSGE